MLVDTPLNEITEQIIGAAIEVHRHLGPGLLEAIYVRCLLYELTARGVSYAVEQRVPVIYKGVEMETNYRVDVIVEGRVVVEIKSIEALLPVHQAQVITYLVLTDCPIGLLINFNVAKLTDGVRRLFRPSRANGAEGAAQDTNTPGTSRL